MGTSGKALSPEFKLLTLLVGYNLDNGIDTSGQIHDLLNGHPEICWKKFTGLVRKHRVVSVIEGAMSRFPFPNEAVTRIKNLRKRVVARNFRMMAQLTLVQAAFSEAGIEFLLLKGFAYAKSLHGDITSRQTKDMDILVKPGNMEAAGTILEQLGYVPVNPEIEKHSLPFRKDISYRHPGEKVIIELHWGIVAESYHNVFTRQDTLDRCFTEAGTIMVSGCPIKTLPPDLDFTYLLHHGSVHLWNRFIRLTDAVLFIEQYGAEKAYAKAVESGYRKSFVMVLELSAMLFGYTPGGFTAHAPLTVRLAARIIIRYGLLFPTWTKVGSAMTMKAVWEKSIIAIARLLTSGGQVHAGIVIKQLYFAVRRRIIQEA